MAAAARKVTPQRKQNNRKAQQRYREKRKAQAQELEVKVALLTTELEKMKAVQGQASQLAEENARLRAALGEQQETTQVLKVRVSAQVLLCSMLYYNHVRTCHSHAAAHSSCAQRGASEYIQRCCAVVVANALCVAVKWSALHALALSMQADQAEDSDSWSPKAKEGPSYDDVVAHLYVVKRSMQELLQGDNIPVDSVRYAAPHDCSRHVHTANKRARIL